MKSYHSEHPLNTNSARVFRRRETSHKLFKHMDGIPKLVKDTQSEVDEFKAELEGSVLDEKAANGEWIDAWNVWNATALYTLGQDIKPQTYLYGVNGEGKHSNIFEKIEEKIADIQDDTSAIQEVARLLESLRMHQTSIQPESLIALLDTADSKFRRNYPKRYYDGDDRLTGKPIPEESQEIAFKHFTKSLKLIRAHVKRILKPEDYLPHDHLILDWRNSEYSIAQLKVALEIQSEIKRTTELTEESIAIPSKEFTLQINSEKNGILFSAPNIFRKAA